MGSDSLSFHFLRYFDVAMNDIHGKYETLDMKFFGLPDVSMV